MSQADVEVVRGLYDAVTRRDAEAVLAHYDAEFEWDFSRVAWGDPGGPRVYRGRDALQSVFRDWHPIWEDYEETVEELMDAGDSVISVVTARGRGRASGAEVEMTTVGVWTVRAGKVVRSVWFPTRREALEAVGLSE